jgi:heterodisulfide reductase subunit A-like polyferredoxin
MDYDALVVGAGIGGMESALKLGDMGYKVLLVEKEASVGGKMILLSKVFPTLDCASCISTPKMGATIHHPNVTVMTYTEVDQIRRDDSGHFRATIRRKPRFVDESLCTGCRECEMACSVAVPDQFNAGMVSCRAAYIAFPQAVPKKAVIERPGSSPCTFNCPAGIKAHGYVSLVRSGEYEKAFDLVLEATPLVGTLGRACYAPCESACNRTRLEGQSAIRRLKRFVADTHYRAHAEPHVAASASNDKRVAIVGSGPAGLTAAWQLARQGYRVKIFEAAPIPEGMLRLAIPDYRLPSAVVEQDIANVTALGVEIATITRVENLEDLKAQGYEAILLATGTPRAVDLQVPGGNLAGITSALAFLRAVKLGESVDLRGKTVTVVGGGNVAIDAARSARRLGAAAVHMVSLESRTEMPALEFEVEEALAEGIVLHSSWGVRQFHGETAVQSVEMRRCTSVFDDERRFNPRYDERTVQDLASDVVILAIGMSADTAVFATSLATNRNKTLQANAGTLQTALPYVFAAGDVVSGPSMITSAVGQGRRAAFMIDRWLQGRELDAEAFDLRLPPMDETDVLRRQSRYVKREPLPPLLLPNEPSDMAELEPPLTEDEARYSAGRCLDCGVCSGCHQCLDACPANAIDLNMREQKFEAEVGTVVLSTGFSLFPADLKPQYGYGRYKNVITGMQMDRLLAPTRPYNTVLRPGDGKVPDRIGFVMCSRSRDKTVGNPLCSKICCMYSIKQNQLIMGALPLADVAVHYVDMRAVGKGYDEFYEQARSMGANYIKGRAAGITEKADGNLILHYEDIDNGGVLAEAEYDLVVLAVGVQPNLDIRQLFPGSELKPDEFGYVGEPEEDLNPGWTGMPGLYVAGAASGAKDIPDSILHAGAAVAQAAAHLERARVRV